MCIEDVIIAGKTLSSEVLASAPVAAGLVLSQDRTRSAIIFCPHATVAYWVNIIPSVAVSRGILIAAAGTPVLIDIIKFGDMLRRPWFAISAGAAITFSILVTSYNEEIAREAGYVEK